MQESIRQFDIYIKESGVSDNTRQAYIRDVRQLKSFLEEHGHMILADVGEAELTEYIEMLHGSGKSAATISRSIASVRKFFSFTCVKGYTFSDPSADLKAPKVIRKSPSVISDREIRKLISVPDITTVKGIRDRAMLELITSTGIGATELTELRVEDVDLAALTVTVGSSRRSISVSKRSAEAMKSYMKVRKKLIGDAENDCGIFFLSCAGEKLTRQGFWKIVRTNGKKAGISEITPQILRHSFAVSALRHGKDAASLQRILGHSSKAGTMEYQSMATSG